MHSKTDGSAGGYKAAAAALFLVAAQCEGQVKLTAAATAQGMHRTSRNVRGCGMSWLRWADDSCHER